MNPELRAPVVLFAFNRPEETKLILEIILQAGERQIFCILDGPRPANLSDKKLNQEVANYLHSMSENHLIKINASRENLGIAERIVSGLNWVFSEVEMAIILEDDCVPDLSFFRYCDELLAKYRNEDSVGIISGFNPIATHTEDIQSSYFSSVFPLTWGWATWKRVWDFYDPSARDWKLVGHSLLKKLRVMSIAGRRYWRFNLNRVTKKSDHQIWDYQFTFSQWVNNRITLIPSVNLVKNVGFSLSATHTKEPGHWLSRLERGNVTFPLNHPNSLLTNSKFDSQLQSKLFSLSRPAYISMFLATQFLSKRQIAGLLRIRGSVQKLFDSKRKGLRPIHARGKDSR